MNTNKQITDRMSSCQKVKSAYDKFAPKIAVACDARFGQGAGEKVKAIIWLAVEGMVADRGLVSSCDVAVAGEREEGLQATAERDRCCDLCRLAMGPLRQTCELAFGPDYARRVGFTGNTPSQPQALYRYAAGILSEIKKVPLPPPALPEVSADPVALALRLEAPVELLGRAIQACGDEQRDSDVAQTAKNAALASFDRSFRLAANLLSSWLEFSGEHDLARRVRPSSRRPGNTAEMTGEEEPATVDAAPSTAPAQPATGSTAVNG